MRSENASPLLARRSKGKRSWIMRGLQERLPHVKCERISLHSDLPESHTSLTYGIFQIFESKPGNRLPWFQTFRSISQCFLVNTRTESQNILRSFFPQILIYLLFMSNLAEHISVSCTQWRWHDPCRPPQTLRSGRKTQTQRKLTCAVGSFRFDSVLPTEGGIFVPVQRSESNSSSKKGEPRLLSRAGTPDRLSMLLHTQSYKAHYTLQKSYITK
jgi:hypothetical protein